MSVRRRSVGARRAGRPRADGRWRRAGLIIVALALIGLAAIVVTVTIRPEPADEIAGVQSFGELSQEHVAGPVDYPQDPPAGGAHHKVWLNCGVYDQPVPNEQAVHSLEHGAVWLTYQPDLPKSRRATLRRLVEGHSHVILSPYPGLRTPVVASAWGRQLRISDVADPRLPQFIKVYEQGRQTPEPGAPCSGGAGTPAS